MSSETSKINSKVKEYSTDGKVTHFTTEEDINVKLGKIIGKKNLLTIEKHGMQLIALK